MTDPRLEHLRRLDTAATPGLWVLWDRTTTGTVVLGDTTGEPAAGVYTEADAEWIATVRRIIPATIDLLEESLQMEGLCYCRELALAVLDQIGADDA